MVSASYSPIHEASLVDASLHSPAMLEMLDIKMSRGLIEYAVECIVDTVDYAMGKPSSSRGRSPSRHTNTNFHTFVTNVLHKAEVKVPVLLVALVYADRAKPHLQIALEQWACERVFLGALILANKYCNDSTLKNIHWALCTGVFGKRDIGRIEREFLDVLDYELTVRESDLLSHHDAIMSLFHSTRLHTRSHHHHSAAVSAPASPRHPQVKLTPVTHSLSLQSRWSSSDSGDDSDDMHSSPSMSPMPVTPGMDIEPAYVPVNAKPVPVPEVVVVEQHPSHHQQHHHVVLPSPPAKAGAHAHHHTQHQHAPAHHRLSSALHLLKSFPIPHFHTSSQQHSSSSLSDPSPLSSSSATSTSSAAVSVSAPIPARCRPLAAAPHAHSYRPAQVVM